MTAIPDSEQQKILIEEFKEAGHLHRLHVGLMFGQITVFLGASGALLHRVASLPPLTNGAVLLFSGVGIFLSLLFLVLHERVYAYSHGARRRAEEIQTMLNLSLYRAQESKLKFVDRVRASTMTRALYILAIAAWLIIGLLSPSLVQPK